MGKKMQIILRVKFLMCCVGDSAPYISGATPFLMKSVAGAHLMRMEKPEEKVNVL